MNNPYTTCCGQLAKTPNKWLITGVAGFIGSNILETLLKLGQRMPPNWMPRIIAD
ncbi:MAG: hypothetical protein HZT41_13015 [Dechloromonas sp.]|nr:MAG: hypothetical protein HZT41_13015 [Dechloromonas sp.]